MRILNRSQVITELESLGFSAEVLERYKRLLTRPYGMILVTGLLAFLGFTILRYRERLITGLATRWVMNRGRASSLGERVLIIGAGECGQLAAWPFRMRMK